MRPRLISHIWLAVTLLFGVSFFYSPAQAEVLRVKLPTNQNYTVQVDYLQAVQVSSVVLKAKAGQKVSAATLALLQRHYEELAQYAFSDLNGGYSLQMNGRSTSDPKNVTLPLHLNFDAPSYSMQLEMVLTPN